MLTAGTGGDRGRDDAADATAGAVIVREPLGEQLVCLQRVDAGCVQAMAHIGIRPRIACEHERRLDRAPCRTVAIASSGCSSSHTVIRVTSPLPSQRGYGRLDRAEVLLVLEVKLVPRRVGQQDREPPDPARVRVYVSALSSGDVEDSGNSRCQWKKPYSSRRRSISVAVGGGSAMRPLLLKGL